jgi:hypothetical protein
MDGRNEGDVTTMMRRGLCAMAMFPIVVVAACGGALPGVARDCPPSQTMLDGTCVSQPIADYVACIRATGATVASNSSKELSAAAGLAGVTASTQAEVQEKLERNYARVSDANALEIIHDCRAKTSADVARVDSPSESDPAPPSTTGGPAQSCQQFAGQWRRAEDGAIFDIVVDPDCNSTVTLPGVGPATGYEQFMRARVANNEIFGRMTRKNPSGCTVILHLRLALQGAKILESIEGVDGQCDIGPSFRHVGWLSK